MINVASLITRYDPESGAIEGVPSTLRRLSDLQGSFAEDAAYQNERLRGDPIIYSVAAVDYPQSEGQLGCALGKIYPGKIGHEYFMTKGHYHAWLPAAEMYVCLSGQGHMILESQDGQMNEMVPLAPDTIVYVPGYTAHRTANTGSAPLVYLGIYPVQAGHDYATIAKQNFRHVLAEINGKPVLIERGKYLAEHVELK